MVDDVLQVLQAPGVGQLVERGDMPVGVCGDRIADEVRADEACAAGDENVNHALYHRIPTSELSPSMNRYADGLTGRR